MSGSNLDGMSGSNLDGMSGSNLEGRRGSNGRSASWLRIEDQRAQRTSQAAGFGAGYVLAAMGSLDAVSADRDSATIQVAGQTFPVEADQLSVLAAGDYVVAGIAESGANAVVYHVGLPYVPGVSAIRVRGPVGSIDPTTGNLVIGSLSVDYTPQLSAEPGFLPDAGDVVEVVGVRPSSDATLIVGSSGRGISVIGVP
jgi:hypothetical protein